MATIKSELRDCLRDGARKGLRQALWLLAIMLPISIATQLLVFYGILESLSKPLAPFLNLLGLPAQSALPLLITVVTNIYSGIAALSTIDLDNRQLTIFALFVLISHNFPIELLVQRKVGTPIWRMMTIRLSASVIGALALNLLMPEIAENAGAVVQDKVLDPLSLAEVLWVWLKVNSILSLKVISLVFALMVLQNILRSFGIIRILGVILAPLMWILGLRSRVAFLWITANTLGLAYGSTLFIDEVKKGNLSRDDTERLNRSIGVCHSLLEDTLLFVVLSVSAVWITLPRIALAIAVVWLYRLRVRNKTS